jgi:hypothetical protein
MRWRGVTGSPDAFPLQVKSWGDLAALVNHFSYFNGHDWLFRGVTDASHSLVPNVGREKTRGLKAEPGTGGRVRVPYRLEDERAVLRMFKQQARPHLQSPPDNDMEWLAVARHFGLPTRLLDWTDGLLVAAWFAVEKAGAKKADAALWITRAVASVDPSNYADPLGIATPAIYRPPHISPRISAQGSVLMVCPTPATEVPLPFVRKIVIERKIEFQLKKRLSACGINRRSLFPDLAGLAGHISWLYKNDWLAGYR